MAFAVYDYRTDVRNVIITPEIRARFFRLEAGEVASRHSHDLGHEVFLVLEGQAEFDIEGARAVVGPGQMCFAYANEMHHVRNVGEGPMTLFLTVTPHLEPTHTQWDGDGNKLPPRYGTSTVAERAANTASDTSIAELASRCTLAARSLASAAALDAEKFASLSESLRDSQETGDPTVAKQTVDAMWNHIYQLYRDFQNLEVAWNELAPAVQDQMNDNS